MWKWFLWQVDDGHQRQLLNELQYRASEDDLFQFLGKLKCC